MIANAVQLGKTRRMLADLEALIAATESGEAGDEGFRDLQEAGLRCQAEVLRREIDQYLSRQRNVPA